MRERMRYLQWLGLAILWVNFAVADMHDPSHALTDCMAAAVFNLAFIGSYFQAYRTGVNFAVSTGATLLPEGTGSASATV